MQIKDITKSGHCFEMENKIITFKTITWQDAIKAQNAIHLIATSTPDNIELGNDKLLKLALKYAIVTTDSGELENLSAENFSALFENIFVCVELSAQFRDYVLSFLKLLPSFQRLESQA